MGIDFNLAPTTSKLELIRRQKKGLGHEFLLPMNCRRCVIGHQLYVPFRGAAIPQRSNSVRFHREFRSHSFVKRPDDEFEHPNGDPVDLTVGWAKGTSSVGYSRRFSSNWDSIFAKKPDPLPMDDGAGQHAVPGRGGAHDAGGVEALLRSGSGPLDISAGAPPAFWERRTHALLVTLVSARRLKVDELRRGIEVFAQHSYITLRVASACC